MTDIKSILSYIDRMAYSGISKDNMPLSPHKKHGRLGLCVWHSTDGFAKYGVKKLSGVRTQLFLILVKSVFWNTPAFPYTPEELSSFCGVRKSGGIPVCP